jgi:polysaccharide export outer membrane protein
MIVQKMKAVVLLSLFVFLTCHGGEVLADPPSPNYQIGPGDQLRIFIWKETELTQDLQVMPDGRITFPLIGEIEAAGKTVTDLKKVITEKLKKFVTAPEVTVIVTESNSRQFYLIGRVARPGPYALGAEMTVLQALSVGGGFAEWADEKSIKIVRRENGKELQLPFNYKEYIGGRNIEQNVLLRPSDTVVVP